MKNLLKKYGIDYLLVNSTNKYLVEYPSLKENSRYTLTGFSGSTGDALVTEDNIFLFVDGRYHIQADSEVKENITVVKLKLGEKQDDEIRKIISKEKILGIVSKKVSQKRLEGFEGYKIKLIDSDPINDYTEKHSSEFEKAFEPISYKPVKPVLITNLEEVSYITGLRDFSKECTSKIWAKLFVDSEKQILFYNDEKLDGFLSDYTGEIVVDKNSINAYDYKLIKYPIYQISEVSKMKSIKTSSEIDSYKKAFERTDKAVYAIRNFIEENENLSEYDIAQKLKEEFMEFGAKSLSFNSIVAINENSALAHYSKNSKNKILKEGDLVLIDCGAYYESGLATDITRVFVKGKPNELQREVYTTVLKAFLHCFKANEKKNGFEIDSIGHKILDNAIDGFTFNHGLGHGIGINVHEIPPNLSQNEVAKTEILNGMTFTIEPGLYNKEHFGIRLENSCYKQNDTIHSFVKIGYEGKLIKYELLNKQEKLWLEEFEIL